MQSLVGVALLLILEFKYDTEKLKQENRYKVQGQAFPKTINCFNWGACILTPIWGIFNNTPIALLSLVIGFIPWFGLFLSIAFSIYCGMKGNEWAWVNKEWQDINHFHYVQRQWAKWAIIIECVFFIFVLVLGLQVANNIDQILNLF